MIYDHSTLAPNEVQGVFEAFDGSDYPVRWWFRDDECGVRFINYAKWMDDLETDHNKIIMKILQKFCMNNEIDINEVYMSRLTMVVQNANGAVVLPERGYPNPEKRFLYFVSSSDMPVHVAGIPCLPKMGGAMLLNGSTEYSIVSPLHDNFFIVAEVEFN